MGNAEGFDEIFDRRCSLNLMGKFHHPSPGWEEIIQFGVEPKNGLIHPFNTINALQLYKKAIQMGIPQRSSQKTH